MQHALALAANARGRTSPNPMVGAVLVHSGEVVGEGWHSHAGAPHAEALALASAGSHARGATLYVTLEPCAHHGRTPPCSDALIAAGAREIYAAVADPNPLVNGRGTAMLRAAGITTHVGLCETESRQLNQPFFKLMTHSLPYVTAKFAASLDGKIATRNGNSQWITGPAARDYGHTLRDCTDAILVGAGTVVADDPQLTTRLADKTRNPKHPLRVIVDSRGRVPASARVFDAALPGKAALATTDLVNPELRDALRHKGIEVWQLPADTNGRVHLPSLMTELGRREHLSVLAEGGAQLLGALFDCKLVDRVCVFLAPLVIGGSSAPSAVGDPGALSLHDAVRLSPLHVQTLGTDLCIEADVISSLTSAAQ